MSTPRRSVRNLLNRNGRYFARLAVPASLRKHVGKRELLKPLGGDRAEALRKLPGCIAEFQEALALARRGESLPPPAVSAPHAARELYRRELEIDLMRRRLVAQGRKEFAYTELELNTKYIDNLLQIAHGPILSADYLDHEKVDRNKALNTLVNFVASSSEDDEGQIGNLHNEMEVSDTFIDASIGYDFDEACRGKTAPVRGTKDWEFVIRELAGARAESLLRIRERNAQNFMGCSKYDDPPKQCRDHSYNPGDPFRLVRRLCR
jgi:hypothetical protein